MIIEEKKSSELWFSLDPIESEKIRKNETYLYITVITIFFSSMSL